MLEINADLGYPGQVVVADVELAVGRGEGVLLVGRNGSVKTTLLRTIAGLQSPVRGDVLVQGDPARRQSTRRHVGLVPDPPPLYEELTPWEHLELVTRLWGRTFVPEGREEEVVALLDLDTHLNQRCDTLSLGWRKRVAISLALLHSPGLLLLDEPFNGLDRQATKRVRSMLRRHLAGGGSFVASTHQPELLDSEATRVVALQAPGVLYDGPIAGWDPDRLEPELAEDDGDDGDEDDEDEQGVAAVDQPVTDRVARVPTALGSRR